MTAAIRLQGFARHFGPVRAVDGVDLEVDSGEVFGFLGPNGAGKTTTLRCLVGLLTPTAGSVRVLGLDPLADHRDLARLIGYVPGELRLYDELTGEAHLELLGDLQGAPSPRRAELCRRLDLAGTALRRRVGTYSRGMKQKLGLVQALQHDPELVVLDEPTEGLDPLVQETFYALLAELREAGRTVFLSSHVLSEVERTCDRVAIIRQGRLAHVGAVSALRAARARHVRLTFAEAVEVDVPEAWSPQWTDTGVRLVIPGNEVVAALRELLAHPQVIDVVVEEAGLEEAFLDYYRHEEPTAVPNGGDEQRR